MVFRLQRKWLFFVLFSFALCAVLVNFSAFGEEKTETVLPVIMYHQVKQNEKGLGKYVISARELENDLLYLQRNGYETVNVKDITEYVFSEKPLPEKPILLSFDDGNESVYAVVEPLMKKYGMKCICCVIGSASEMFSVNEDHNIAYSSLTWQQIHELSMGDTVEVHTHTYELHNSAAGKRKGMGKLPGESEEQYAEAIKNDIDRLHRKLLSLGAADNAMVYPFGICNKTTEGIIKKLGYQASFTCEEKVNILRLHDKSSLYKLGRYNRPSGVNSGDFFRKVSIVS